MVAWNNQIAPLLLNFRHAGIDAVQPSVASTRGTIRSCLSQSGLKHP